MSIDKDLLDRLMEGRSAGDLFGKEGILSEPTKALAERAFTTEMEEHLGGERAEEAPEGRNRPPDRRNGRSRKTVTTDSGKVVPDIPRDRNATFDPLLTPAYQRRFPEFDRKIISMYARGMTTREIQGHIEEIDGFEASPSPISAVTGAAMAFKPVRASGSNDPGDRTAQNVTAWQNRPLEPCCPVVFMDAIWVSIRSDGAVSNKAVFVALAILPDGTRDVPGLWVQANEGAKFRAKVLNDLRNRGVQDILLAVVDGLEGFPQAIDAAFPRTQVRTCVRHRSRTDGYRCLTPPAAPLHELCQRQGPHGRGAALKAVYTAVDADAAEAAPAEFEDSGLAARHPAIAPGWRRAWTEVVPFLDYPPELRRLICTTNAIEAPELENPPCRWTPRPLPQR